MLRGKPQPAFQPPAGARTREDQPGPGPTPRKKESASALTSEVIIDPAMPPGGVRLREATRAVIDRSPKIGRYTNRTLCSCRPGQPSRNAERSGRGVIATAADGAPPPPPSR